MGCLQKKVVSSWVLEWSVDGRVVCPADIAFHIQSSNESIPGAPLDLAPQADDPVLAKDKLRNNDFNFDFPGDRENQDRCPFTAHIRKVSPREDFGDFRRIMRRGIAFGPEVSTSEQATGKTIQDRGLIFRCYQSDIATGFRFIQLCEFPLIMFYQYTSHTGCLMS